MCRYTITRWPEIEWADEADDCDGADNIGPRSTPLTSLSERRRVKQQSGTQVNHFIYSSLALSLPVFVSLSFSHLSLPPFCPLCPTDGAPDGGAGWREGRGIDGERITVKRID